MEDTSDNSKQSVIKALLETLFVGFAYIILARSAVGMDFFGASGWFPAFSEAESQVAGEMTNGAIAQIFLVAILLVVPQVRQAISTIWQSAPKSGWIIAGSVLMVDVITLYAGWIGDFGKLIDMSPFGISMSVIPSFDGITQEIIFRGYVILRLAQAGISRFGQIAASGFLFGSIHFGYGQMLDLNSLSSLLSMFVPFAGTFGLGAAWAFAFQESEYKLQPVIVSHMLVIVFVQPWLALSYSAG